MRSFLTSTLDGGERTTSRPGRFTRGKEHRRYSLNMRLPSGGWGLAEPVFAYVMRFIKLFSSIKKLRP
jgi:hypothetical protein